jgi:G protein-coupled receptor kinase
LELLDIWVYLCLNKIFESFLKTFLAPEVIRGEYYSFSPDFFSLGCLVYEMIEGNPAFRNLKEKAKKELIDKRVLESLETYSSKFSVPVREFISMV